MVGDEDKGVEEMTNHAVERPAVREAPVTTAHAPIYIAYTYIHNSSTQPRKQT